MILRSRSTLWLVAAAALSLAALRSASPAWSSGVWHFVLLALVIATIRARVVDDARSAWWFGFALFGWVSFLFADQSGLMTGLLGALLHPFAPQYFRNDDDPEIRAWICRYDIAKRLLGLVAGLIGGTIVSRCDRRSAPGDPANPNA